MSSAGRREVEVAIVGGGGAGCAAALDLARRGVRVALFEKGFAGGQASGVNFGGVRQQGRVLPELPLARRARGIWARLESLIGIDGEFVANGHLRVLRSEAEVADAEAYAKAAKEHGLALELLGRNAVRERYPWLAESVIGASWCAEDGAANPRLVAPAFARAARAAGAEINEFAPVAELARDGDRFVVVTVNGGELRAGALVNVAGAWGGRVAAAFGEPVPISSVAPQMVVSEPVPHFIGPVLGMPGDGIYLRQISRGNVIFGGRRGAVDMDAGRAYVRPANTRFACRVAVALIPQLRPVRIIRTWSGVEGEMPDEMPVIGPSRTTPGLFHAFGFSGHGFQLGPAVGEILGELVTTGATTTPIAAFDIARFAESAGEG